MEVLTVDSSLTEMKSNMISRAMAHLGDRSYAGWIPPERILVQKPDETE